MRDTVVIARHVGPAAAAWGLRCRRLCRLPACLLACLRAHRSLRPAALLPHCCREALTAAQKNNAQQQAARPSKEEVRSACLPAAAVGVADRQRRTAL